MSKAEERAQAAYPTWRNGIGDEFSSNSAYYGFIEGYHQAEKDLEITIDDIMKLDALLIEMWNKPSNEDKYQEVLKRFKAQKVDIVMDE